MGYSNFQAPALDCSYGLQESIPGTGQLNSRVSTLGGFCGSKEIVHRAEQMNTFASSSNYYYSNQRSIHGLDTRLPQQRWHGLCHHYIVKSFPLHAYRGNCISDPITFRIVFSPRITCRSSTLKSLKGSDIHYFCISIAVHGRSSIFDHLVLRRTDNLGTGQVETNEA
ncbi:(-)-isopiperitenol/(-)-carveol dehydrogenase, mitochondrial [Olea europaea subsp. europaea]|uniref:(-)-isopiperitenol/(-)-carveol dehydrogenase, mitochondrial n=1 Tax=Olea europaea subsp. europaea TaxID=158383 RepID=A0A8S0P9M2_OLEEU|nr:(-)-isopiperitenol/(-)-carveol dehydrogenase, mitochondrial [Olea europaea subsp. europaea]